MRRWGWKVVSPAEIDRENGHNPPSPPPEWFCDEVLLRRDFYELVQQDAIVLIDGWEYSPGTNKEIKVARWSGLDVYLYYENYSNGLANYVQSDWDEIDELLEGAGVDRVQETRVIADTGGAKGQKLSRFDLIPPEALKEVAICYGIGAKDKYEDWNWAKGYPYSLSIAALERHFNDWKSGESLDDDGFHHLAAVVFHALTLIDREKHAPEFDDRRDINRG